LTDANRNLLIRLATAVVMVPAILALLYVLPPVSFYALVAVASLVGGLELFGMVAPDDAVSRWIGGLTCLGVSLSLYFYGHHEPALYATFFAVPVLAVLVPLWRLGDIATAGLRITAGGFGPVYVASLTLLAIVHRDRGADGPGFVVMTLMLAWFGDTFGYFFGRFLGKHKLYPAVSPKKTIEGALGGLFGSVTGALLAHFIYLKSLPLVHGVILAVVAGALGQLGDLGESLLKRSTGVKDSGAIVPGHGGILDRIDALLLASVVVYLYTRFALA
jgi:phosphatidate cytidylyltransferase